MIRKKCSANRLKKMEPVKHIKLLFSMFRKIFNNSPRGLKLDFMNLRMKNEDDDETKRFSKSAEKFRACYAYQIIIFYVPNNFQQLYYGFKNLI